MEDQLAEWTLERRKEVALRCFLALHHSTAVKKGG